MPDVGHPAEDEGRTSWESLTAVADQMTAAGPALGAARVGPVPLGAHQGHGAELGLEAYVSPTRTSPVTGLGAFRRMLKEAAGVAAARVIGWDRLTSWTELTPSGLRSGSCAGRR